MSNEELNEVVAWPNQQHRQYPQPLHEVHTVDGGLNTGAAIIVAAGGGHNTPNVGSENADFVPYFCNYGVNTVILCNRLRRDGRGIVAFFNQPQRSADRRSLSGQSTRRT